MTQFHPIGDTPPEEIHLIEDAKGAFIGAIVLHSTVLGPAAGGCRLWNYDNREALTIDAIRLARGMSYKNAMAGLPFGGGKAVLQCPDGDFDRAALFERFAEAVEALGGAYVTAEDVGTAVTDMERVRTRTNHVAGLHAVDGMAGGDPSPWTALGVLEAMRVAVQARLGKDLADVAVAVQGAGNVGGHLCRMLAAEGARLMVADADERRAQALAAETGARVFPAASILEADAEVFAPCALGAVLDRNSIPRLRASVIAGAANNQLATAEDGALLHARDILYAPDYVANAGGIINVAAEYLGETAGEVEGRVRAIGPRMRALFERAVREKLPTNIVADRMARHIIANAAGAKHADLVKAA
ncbi:Glu/Leu/Phe/Val dehydrogenase dimerization domain-containing protein [Sphingomonas sp. LaA6.9]|uniref:Leu/Phe/Val dehydrogenase n=1 Tax=Sphingomonas sp. LaA6.9 TaxID=2919914 RepID=UPI001F4F281F|nr:Glu/Leu/Phe/Val dehydrogenase dimerization domain-containing protein [Sphingomonas sp. LaA6.9]MCJ8156965.1 amino acid dehydrogenase [Sphingomonas sp. LaA6.9]